MRGTLRLLRVTWETKMYLNLKNSDFCKRVTTRSTGLRGDWLFLGSNLQTEKAKHKASYTQGIQQLGKDCLFWDKILSYAIMCMDSLFHQLQRAPTKQPHCKRLIKSHSASHLLYSVSLKCLSNQGFPSSLFFILLINI